MVSWIGNVFALVLLAWGLANLTNVRWADTGGPTEIFAFLDPLPKIFGVAFIIGALLLWRQIYRRNQKFWSN